ncbi:MAG: MFS transporter [Candidatus Omnitrophota bacterium]
MIKDRRLIFLSSALRACAISFSSVILALYLSAIGMSVIGIGFCIAAGFAGSALMTLAVVFLSHRFGKKGLLVLTAFLMGLGGLVFALSSQMGVILLFSLVGLVNGMGRDRGAAATLEQTILPETAPDSQRTRIFAWYNVWVDAGHSAGALLGVLPVFFRAQYALDVVASYQWCWVLYGVICVVSGSVILGLSKEVSAKKDGPGPVITPGSRSIIRRFALLSGLDSFGGGFLTTALISFWFFKRFGVDEAFLGVLFFFARVANIFSHLAAAAIARRIGLVKTMVFTHLPSSLLLMTIPFMPNIAVAVVLFLIRESLVEMDVPTRQSYIAAVVRPEERVHAAGVSNVLRIAAWGAGSAIAGVFGSMSLALPLVIGPGVKVAYDLLLYREFRHIKPPEE